MTKLTFHRFLLKSLIITLWTNVNRVDGLRKVLKGPRLSNSVHEKSTGENLFKPLLINDLEKLSYLLGSIRIIIGISIKHSYTYLEEA